MANATRTFNSSEKDMSNTPWEVVAFRLINTACRESAVAHAKALRAKRVRHTLYGLEQRARFVEQRA